ncbi:MAG TPA: flagellar basal body L-ring protein FlgH [Gemmatimonadales bacterium]|jgi:flagellar L-ring protein precursor FlgH
MKAITLVAAIALVPAVSLAAQKKNAPPPKDTVAPAPPVPQGRLSWTSDRRPLRVGDLLTIVVDEQTAASESSTSTAHATRAQNGTLNTELAPEKLRSLGIGYDASSDAGSAAARQGDLTAVLSVRITAIEPGGIAKITGQKVVNVDGRKQEVRLAGTVRAEDVAADNTILSNRVADAVISYQGKKLGPTTGILGKILAILWP